MRLSYYFLPTPAIIFLLVLSLNPFSEASGAQILHGTNQASVNDSYSSYETSRDDLVHDLKIVPSGECRFNSTNMQGCSKVAFYNNISYITYMKEIISGYDYSIYVRKYDHETKLLSEPYYVGTERADHAYPCIYVDSDGYLHIFFGARPFAAKHMISVRPEDPSEWSSEEIGSSATYLIPNFIDADNIMMLYREGDSYAASLDLATYKDTGWSIKNVIARSSIFIPMPMDYFMKDNKTCFLFNMRDKMAGKKAYNIYCDYIRESISVVCTEDGDTFTDLDGNTLSTPLNYSSDFYNFPRVVKEEPIEEIATQNINGEAIFTHNFSDLDQDGSVIELEITKENYDEAYIDLKNGDQIIHGIKFQTDGKIVATSALKLYTLGNYTANSTSRIRIKYYLSFENNPFCRIWLDGRTNTDVYSYYIDGVILNMLGVKYVRAENELAFDVSAVVYKPKPLHFSATNLPQGAIFFHYGEVDLNKDGILGTLDFSIFSQAYNSVIGDQGYNADCDFNKDGSVNNYDFEVFKSVYKAGTGSIYKNPYYLKGHFSWIPEATQTGNYTVNFKVNDGQYYHTEPLIIQVSSPRPSPETTLPPSVELLPEPASAEENETINTASATIPSSINNIEITGSNLQYSIKIMKDYKLRTATTCLDKNEKVNIIFPDKRDSLTESAWPLMHYRNGIIREIPYPEGIKLQRPSCIADERGLYLLSDYFDDEDDTFHELHLLTTRDYINWYDMIISEPIDPINNAYFSKQQKPEGYKRFLWTEGKTTINPAQPEPAILKYGYFTTTPSTEPPPPVKFKKDF